MLLSITSSAAFETRISISIASAYFKIDFLIPLLSTLPPYLGDMNRCPLSPPFISPSSKTPYEVVADQGLLVAVEESL